jgi:superfamily II DNA or RNA helicase
MRTFNKRQKQFLFALHDGKCAMCGDALKKGWHADHIIPFSKGGETILSNGQALCPECNLSKSNKMIKLRKWQDKAANKYFSNFETRKNFFLEAGVGAGKTFWACYVTAQLIKKHGFDSVIVVSNTENIRDNWHQNLRKNGFQIETDNDFSFKYHWKPTFQGVCCTYQSFNYDSNTGHMLRIVDRKTIVIIDEAHHLGVKRKWGDAIKAIGDKCGKIISLSGTPTRSDNTFIPFAEYQITGDGLYEIKPDFRYTFEDAVRDGVVCPLSFHKYIGRGNVGSSKLELSIKMDNESSNFAFKKLLNNSEYVFELWREADEKLKEVREKRPKSGGLLVCKSIGMANLIGKRIKNIYGDDYCVVIHSDSDENSNKQISKFKDSRMPWIISVQQISEGVDIPRIRVIGYCHTITTELFFRQVSGRGVRNPKHRKNDHDICYMFIPEHYKLVEIADNIERDIKHAVDELKQNIIEYTKKEPEDPVEWKETILSNVEAVFGSINTSGIDYYKEDVDWLKEVAMSANADPDTFRYFISVYEKMRRQKPDDAIDENISLRERKDNLKKTLNDLILDVWKIRDSYDPNKIKMYQGLINGHMGVRKREQATPEQLESGIRYCRKMIENS